MKLKEAWTSTKSFIIRVIKYVKNKISPNNDMFGDQ